MSRLHHLSRRRFVQGTAGLVAASPFRTSASDPANGGLQGRIYKTLKIGMVSVPGSLSDKFRAVKDAGFSGIELNAPGMDVPETRQAIAETGLVVDGTVCESHWRIRHTSPDKAERTQALKDLKIAIRDTHAVGGHTVLLVVGKGVDGSDDEIWTRSIENISKAIPLAAKLGIYIAVENVWNQFLYDHDGGADQTADQYVKYVDRFNSPWIGMQFDIGNHWKYGNTGDWIRQLGQRIVKLDLKGFSRERNKFSNIGEGDVDWADVRRALEEINFVGWAAAEVKGGDFRRLREISTNMDRVFGLSS